MPSYIAPADGAITSWRTEQFGAGQPGATLALVVLRPEMSGFSVVAVDSRTLPGTIPNGDIVFAPGQPIPIGKNDRIGLYGPDANEGCFFSGTQASGDVMRFAEFPSPPSPGAPVVPDSHESIFHRIDVAAEMTLGAGGGDGTLTSPSNPERPTIDADGKPRTTTKGPNVQVDVAQRIFCPPLTLTCSVTTTARAPQPTVKASTASSSRKKATIVVGSRHFTVAPGKSADVVVPPQRL